MKFLFLFISAMLSGLVLSDSAKVLRSRRIGFEGQIIAKLLAEYDPHTRPPVRDSAENTAIIVVVTIFLKSITWHTHRAEIALYLRQQWLDTRLAYETDEREGINQVTLPVNRQIWNPDTYFSGGEDVSETTRRSIFIEPDGSVRSSELRKISVPIEFGDRFPFSNMRKFLLRLSSYNYPLEDVAYMWADHPPVITPLEVSQELKDGTPFAFTSAESGWCMGNYTVGAYSCIEVTLTFKGSATEAIFRIFIPSIFLIFISWLHFWVHGSWSVPRTFSAAIPFFIIAAVMIFYPQPFLSHHGIGGLQIWFIFCLFLTFASFVEYFIVICCGVRRSVRYLSGTGEENPLTAAREVTEAAYDTKCSNLRNNNGVDIIARVLFPLVFVVFLIIFLLVYLL